MRVLRNCWYMIGWSKEIAPGQGLMRVVAEEPIQVERDAGGHVSALSEKPGNRKIAVADKHRILWVWLGEESVADLSRIPDFSCYDDIKETAIFCGYLPTQANYELVTDNILDLSHADFLHPDTLGGGMVTRTSPALERKGDVMTIVWDADSEVAPPVFDRMLPQPGQNAHVRIEVRWHPAAAMLLRAQVSPAGESLEDWFDIHAAHIVTPQSEFSTHYFYGALRNYKQDDAEFSAMQAKQIGNAFANEDKPLIEAQQRAMGQSDLWGLNPVLLPIDIGAVQVRRALARLIDRERRAA